VLITPGNFKIGGGFKFDKLKYTGEECPEDYVLKEGEIIVTMTDLSKKGDTLGYSAKVPKIRGLKFLHNQRIGLLIFENNDIEKDFLYWVMREKKYNYLMVGSSTGSTVKHTSPERIKEYNFLMPPRPEQKAIAKILSDLDTKIDLDIRMAENLESLGQRFFNNELVNLENIPSSWKSEPLDNIADFLNGLALQKYPAKSGEKFLPAIKIRELKNGITDQTDKVNTNLPEEYVIHDGDILFSWSGSLELVIWTNGKGALNQHLFKVTSKEYPRWFYYSWIKHHLSFFQHIAKSKATTMGHIQKHHLTEAEVLIPDKKTLDKMTSVMGPLIEKIISLRLEASKLSKIRDILLPKLMSGEIRVK
jgi:type I restriction enzyme S subunit